MLGVQLVGIEPGTSGLQALPLMAFGAGLSAAAFAFASYAPPRSLLPIAATASVGGSVWYVLFFKDAGAAWATASAALVIGVLSYGVAGRFRVPPLVVVVPSIIPLLPGLSIFRGLRLMAEGDSYGVIALATAAATAIAIASGVILGEYIAQPLKREVRRLESRLAGPRLVGPIRARAVQRDKKRQDAS